ncbi:enoyl-CoA hydratase/isomerase family protein [Commensalibacter oyaizuii]|uniref:3-hydroxyisobutyryl-CoA hydrolase n=1 Tax=Commensalibacter oyaizuii TaxID=3043873 RepID=A0ABT6Q1N6_9PROT|nr:enoyl-CoA hydratase/isomerase family protein [Commensalibacter sp. TBRC 16381]MDI2091024.1 enoyl-CoA hydratase/isomerase family protein [Commensalibacter sp. TBRC 16381]
MKRWIIAQEKGQLGILTLNRPQALNAIDGVLQREIIDQLECWKIAEHIKVIIINSSQPKAFCAGGDIRQITTFLKQGDYEQAIGIFKHNYELVNYVAHYPKSVVSVMDGITMGGGIGLGAFVPYRIVTERSVLAMPEVMIGLTPDAGSNLLFGKAPGYTGLRAMLTGLRFQAEDAIRLGFADYIVPSIEIEALISQLETANPEELLQPYKRDLQFDPQFLQEVKQVYDSPDIETIITNLETCNFNWAKTDMQAMQAACPFSLWITYKAWHRKLRDLGEVLQQDLNLISHLIARPDFIEGVRASVIDKDRNPKWDRGKVSSDLVDMCFTTAHQF